MTAVERLQLVIRSQREPQLITARGDGWRAGHDQKPLTANPYEPESDQAELWSMGWRDARQENS